MSENRVGTTIEDAVKAGDIARLRSSLATAIKMDPCFRSGDYERKLAYIQRNGIDIFEPYQEVAGEFAKPKDSWSEEYFFYHAEWILDNFSLERIKLLREIGQTVFSTPQSSSQTRPSTQPETFSGVPAGTAGHRKATPSPHPKRSCLLLFLLAALIAVVLAVTLLLRNGAK